MAQWSSQLIIFDGLTVMISACHFQAKRGRSGFDSPSESSYQLFRVHVPEHRSEKPHFFVLFVIFMVSLREQAFRHRLTTTTP